MYCVREIKKDIYWIGGNDRRITLFENVYPITSGVSYNSYFIDDEKTVLLDTVDKSIAEQFLENLNHVLNNRKLDYMVVHHMEPDHAYTIGKVVALYPEVKIICGKKTVEIIKQYFDFNIDSRALIVNEGDTISFGKHNLTFVSAPMVHWPEVMLSYDSTDKILFSADAFGTFGALNGHIFSDEIDFESEWLDEARRYYTNIVGKYGVQVMSLLNKAANLDIQMVCPLHGPVWRNNLEWYIDKYKHWATYTPEVDGVMIAYASVYGNTEAAVNLLASELSKLGVKNIRMYDVSSTHPSVIVSESFKHSHLVFASITYNGDIFSNMKNVLLDLKAHNLQNRKVAIIENGSWSVTCGKQMKEILGSMKNIQILDDTLCIKSSVKESQRDNISNMAKELINM